MGNTSNTIKGDIFKEIVILIFLKEFTTIFLVFKLYFTINYVSFN